jgi:prepilin-type processing-associated H-X9-DG protein
MKTMQCNRNIKRRGWSLVDVVTVAACVLLLLAVGTPALTQIRSAARQQDCKNNLKQLVLALHNYHDVYRVFPPGWISLSEQPDAGPRYGWQTSILPFVDQNELYQLVDFNVPLPAATGIFQREADVYRCPADATPSTNPLRGNYGTSNYSGNYGTATGPGQQGASLTNWLSPRRTQFWPGQLPAVKRANGIFWRNSNVGIRDITDGTSNSFAIGERSAKSGAGIWPGVQSNQFTSDAVTSCGPGSELNSGFDAFSSYHSGGANFAFCDGAVRFISNHVNPTVYRGVSTRNGGELVGEF